jgi:hypothetical protein
VESGTGAAERRLGAREGLALLRRQCKGMEELTARLGLERLSAAGRVDGRYVTALYSMLDTVEGLLAERGEGPRQRS